MQSPFGTLLGLQIAAWDETRVALALLIAPETRNLGGMLHGGAIATLIDMAGSMAGCYNADPNNQAQLFTVSLSLSVNFVSPAREGVVTAHGRKTGGGSRIYMSSVDVTDAAGRIIATGQGAFKIISHSKK